MVVAPLGRRGFSVRLALAALAIALAGRAAYAVETVVTPHTGSIPPAGQGDGQRSQREAH